MKKIISWILVVVWMIFIFVLSNMNSTDSGNKSQTIVKKTVDATTTVGSNVGVVEKPSEEKIEKAFVKLVRKLNLNAEAFTYKIGHDTFKIAIKDILYFESNKRKVIIHYNDKEDEFYGSLENIQQQLNKYNFLLIHKSYLINPVHVRKCTYEFVEMPNRIILPIAQSKRKEIREQQLELVNHEEV